MAQIFEQLGGRIGSLADLGETLLIDRGRCAARSYVAGDLMAIWLVEVRLVQFYDAQGNMLRTVSLFDGFEPQRKAA